jgi:ABC-type arginine transport system permease subunit
MTSYQRHAGRDIPSSACASRQFVAATRQHAHNVPGVPNRPQVVTLATRLVSMIAVHDGLQSDEFQSDAASGRLDLAFPEVEWH